MPSYDDLIINPIFAPTDMADLDKLLTEKRIKHVLRRHPVAVEEPGAKELIGYNPAGDWQIIIRDRYSVIRGAISFGNYEIYNIKCKRLSVTDIMDGKPEPKRTRGVKFYSPERFATPEELVEAL